MCVITSYVSVCRCYSCDNDIPVDISKRVQECVDFLRKQAGLPRLEFSHFSSEGLPFVQVSYMDIFHWTVEIITIFSEKTGTGDFKFVYVINTD